MNTLQRYMVLNSLLLVVIPVMSQQKEDKEIKLNEETVKLIQFDFLPGIWRIITSLWKLRWKRNGWNFRILLIKESPEV